MTQRSQNGRLRMVGIVGTLREASIRPGLLQRTLAAEPGSRMSQITEPVGVAR